MSFLIATAQQPDTLCLQLYYDIQSSNHAEIPVSKTINEESFKMVFSSSNLIEIRGIVSEEWELIWFQWIIVMYRSGLFKDRKQNWASKLHLITYYKAVAEISAPHKLCM